MYTFDDISGARRRILRVSTPKELGALVKDRRRKRGLSQEDLATLVGVSRQWIIGLEQGRARAYGLVLRTLATLGLVIHIVESEPDREGGHNVDLDAVLRSLDVDDP